MSFVTNATKSLNLPTTATASAPEDRKQAMLWLNVGIKDTYVNAEGETVEGVLSIPFGIPLDTMEKLKVSGKASNFNNMRKKQNALLEQLIQLGLTGVAQGDSAIIPQLVVELRHVAPADIENTDENVDFGLTLSL